MLTVTDPAIAEVIGGDPALAEVIDDLYAKVLLDPELTGFFARPLRGAWPDRGACLRDVPGGDGIRQQHLDLVSGHLAAALTDAGVPADTAGQIIAAIAPMATEIVSYAARLSS